MVVVTEVVVVSDSVVVSTVVSVVLASASVLASVFLVIGVVLTTSFTEVEVLVVTGTTPRSFLLLLPKMTKAIMATEIARTAKSATITMMTLEANLFVSYSGL